MSEDWAGIAAEVAEALASVGAPAHILRAGAPTGPEYNRTPGTDTLHPCTVVYSRWDARQIDGSAIRVADQRLLVSVSDLDIVPEVGDKFWSGEMDGANRVTKQVVPPLTRIAPAGQAVLYILNVRG